MKETIIRGIEETGAFDLGFQIDNKKIKNTFLCFLGMGLMDMTYQRTLESILIKSFNRRLQSDAFIKT